MLTKEQILSANDLDVEKMSIPEWGGDVYIRPLSSRDRDRWESQVATTTGKITYDNLRAKLVARSICDEQGNLLFSDSDVEALGNKSAAAMQRIFNRLLEINTITDEDIDELAKN